MTSPHPFGHAVFFHVDVDGGAWIVSEAWGLDGERATKFDGQNIWAAGSIMHKVGSE